MPHEIAVVVGVGPGLGWALAKRFADSHMQVVAAARKPDKLVSLTRAEPKLDVRFEACDAAQPQQVSRLFEAIAS